MKLSYYMNNTIWKINCKLSLEDVLSKIAKEAYINQHLANRSANLPKAPSPNS
jgi:uncharacterized protein YihD (DUF1040 family)